MFEIELFICIQIDLEFKKKQQYFICHKNKAKQINSWSSDTCGVLMMPLFPDQHWPRVILTICQKDSIIIVKWEYLRSYNSKLYFWFGFFVYWHIYLHGLFLAKVILFLGPLCKFFKLKGWRDIDIHNFSLSICPKWHHLSLDSLIILSQSTTLATTPRELPLQIICSKYSFLKL